MLVCVFMFAEQLKEKEGDVGASVNLYLKAGLPARAARIIMLNEVHMTCLLNYHVNFVC